MPQGETNEVLLASLSEMFLQIGVLVTILEAVRIMPARAPATATRRGAPLVKVVFSSREDRNAVLSSKRQLSTKERFKRVYIEPNRQRHERITEEANMRLFGKKKCPGLEFRRGQKIDSARNGTGAWINKQALDDNESMA